MPDMFEEPVAMTPLQRRREIAAILAKGVLSLRYSASTLENSNEKGSVSGKTCLELDAISSPHVPIG